MKKVMLRILQEIGISILLLLIIGIVVVFAFSSKVPYNKEIPESINYKNIDQSQYEIIGGGVENAVNDTATYVTDPRDIQQYELEQRFISGNILPFSSNGSSDSDIPDEVITSGGGQTTDGSTGDGTADGTTNESVSQKIVSGISDTNTTVLESET